MIQRLKINDLRLMIFCAIFIIHYSLIINPAFALEASNSASPSAQLRSKIKALQEEIASKAAKIKLDISKKLQNKAFVGFIKAKSTSSLTIATDTGSKIVNVNEDTQYSSKLKLNFKTLENEDFVAALGDIDEAQMLTAKKIIKLVPVEESKKIAASGVVTGIGSGKFTISLKSETIDLKKNSEFKIDQDTIIYLGKSEVESSEIKFNSVIGVILESTKKGDYLATLVYIFPQVTNFKTKTATPSATLKSASPSAKVASSSAKSRKP